MRDKIETACKALALSQEDCRLVSPHQHFDITEQIARRFTILTQHPLKYRWWWEHFKKPSRSIQATEPLSVVSDLLDPSECYWFMAEDWESKKNESPFWLYEMSGRVIPLLLRETHYFEYYIVDRKMTWMLCENHHGVLIGVGEPILRRLPHE